MELLKTKEEYYDSQVEVVSSVAMEMDYNSIFIEVNSLEKPRTILTNNWRYNVYFMEAIDALENSIKSCKYHELMMLYYKLACLSYHMGQYSLVINFCKKAYKYVSFYDVNDKEMLKNKITLLQLMSYKKTYRYDDLLKEVSIIKNKAKEEDTDFIHQVMVIEAKAFVALKKYNIAIEILSLLENKEDIDIHLKKEIHLQMSICYRFLEDVENSNNSFYKACHIIEHHQKEIDVKLLLEKAERNYNNKKYTEALQDLEQVRGYLEAKNIQEGLIEVYSLMGEIHATNGNLIKSKKCYSKIREQI